MTKNTLGFEVEDGVHIVDGIKYKFQADKGTVWVSLQEKDGKFNVRRKIAGWRAWETPWTDYEQANRDYWEDASEIEDDDQIIGILTEDYPQ